MMTSKNFQNIADALLRTRYEDWASTVVEIAAVCEANNPNFNRSWFYKACGVHECTTHHAELRS